MKNKNLMLCTFTSLIVTMSPSTHAEKQGRESGGGDMCENRIKIIRDDIKKWINDGGHQGLDFSNDATTPTNDATASPLDSTLYESTMLNQINTAKIQCVAQGDTKYPIAVNDTPKICRFDKIKKSSFISCDLNKFQNLSEADQYILIHHEYAGLADIEIPNQNDSDYKISNQISEYLVDQIVKKLAVKSKAPICLPSKATNKIHAKKGDTLDINQLIVGCSPTDPNEIQNTYWFIPKTITRSESYERGGLYIDATTIEQLLLFLQPPNTLFKDSVRISKLYSYGSTSTDYKTNKEELCAGKISGGVNMIDTTMNIGYGEVIWDVSNGIAKTGTTISIRMLSNSELSESIFKEFKDLILQHRTFYKPFVTDHPISLTCKNYERNSSIFN